MVTSFYSIVTLRKLREESINNAYGGATAGLKITPFPKAVTKKHLPEQSNMQRSNTDQTPMKPMLIKPLY